MTEIIRHQEIDGGEWYIAADPVLVHRDRGGLFIQYQPQFMAVLKEGIHYKKETVYVGPFEAVATEPRFDKYANLFAYTTFNQYHHPIETGVIIIEEIGTLTPIKLEIGFYECSENK